MKDKELRKRVDMLTDVVLYEFGLVRKNYKSGRIREIDGIQPSFPSEQHCRIDAGPNRTTFRQCQHFPNSQYYARWGGQR